MGVDNKTPEFLAKFPMGKVPALECADGFNLAEGAAICKYLANSGPKAQQLLGSDAKTQAVIDSWIYFSESELNNNISPPAGMTVFKIVPFDEARYNFFVGGVERALQRLEVALKGGKKYLVGDNLTLADVIIAGPISFSTGFLIDAEMRKGIPNVVAWIQNLTSLPEFKALGELKLCETRVKA